MAIERGDSDSPVGGVSADIPSTYEQSVLRGTTSTGNAKLVVRDATEIQVIDSGAKFLATTVEGVLDELADEVDSLVVGSFYWGAITGTLSNQTDLQAELALKLNKAGDTMTGDLHFADNVNILLGTGDDAGIYYNGNDLFIAPKLVGSGGVEVLGNISGNTTPSLGQHLTRKDYVDAQVAAVASQYSYLITDITGITGATTSFAVPSWCNRFVITATDADFSGSVGFLYLRLSDSTGEYATGYKSQVSYISGTSTGSFNEATGLRLTGNVTVASHARWEFVKDPVTNVWVGNGTSSPTTGNGNTFCIGTSPVLTNDLNQIRLIKTGVATAWVSGEVRVDFFEGR